MKIAILIVNYNMPERTNALVEQVNKSSYPHDTIVIDNGSDLTEPSKYTTLKLDKNIQTTGGWLAGLNSLQEKYFAYMLLITSAEIPEQPNDLLSSLASVLHGDDNAVGVHPCLTKDSTSAWKHLVDRDTNGIRQTWMIDNICSLYRADWFDSIGRFDPNLRYAWGIDLETCHIAKTQGRSIWVDERVTVKKVTNIGYIMDRMNMTAEDRTEKASRNMLQVLYKKYGVNWWHIMTEDKNRYEQS